jgi:hypothetical protein
MPNIEIQRLTPDSSEAQIAAARSACIAEEIRNGRDRDQAVAMCMEMVRRKTGKGAAAPAPEGGV